MKQDNIKQTFAKYVSLNILGMIGLSCYILADTFFVAQGIGANGLTALNLAIPFYSFVNGTGLMIGMGAATRFAISKSDKVFTQALYYTCLMSCIFVTLGLFFTRQIASALGADGQILQNTSIYLKTILCFAPMFLLNNVIICFVRNDGNPKLSMLAMLLGSFANIILDYIFIFPFKMGMFGAAFATGLAPVISLLILSTYFFKKKNTFHIFRLTPKLKGLFDISSLGVSALITEFSSGVVIIVFNAIILKLEGNIGVAAYGILANIALVIIAVFTGISQGMQPIVSHCYGAQNIANTKKVLKYGYTTAVVLSMAVYVLSVVFAEPIVEFFNKDSNEQLTLIATNGLRIYFTAFIFVGINILSATYFSAVGNPKNAFIISLLRGFVIIIPITLILSISFGVNGVWIAMTLTELIVFLISISMLRRNLHKA